MIIQKVKKRRSGYLVNDKISIPNDPDNSQYKIIQKWIEEGGIVDNEFTFQEIKNKKIFEIKSQAYSRIVSTYPDYKQRNLDGAVSLIQNKELLALKAGSENYTPTEEEMVLLRAAKVCKEFIDAIRTKSNELTASLDSMTEEQLNAFDPSEDSNWE